MALHYLRNREEARDLAQEVFIRVYQRLGSFAGGELPPWILQVARNACIDRLRRIKARPPLQDVPAEDWPELAGVGASPEVESELAERKRLLYRALGEVGEKHREILILKEIEGLRLEQIAEMLGVPLGTIKSRSNRARLELAACVCRLDPSADGRLEPIDSELVHQHVGGCSSCAMLVGALRAMERDLPLLAAIEPGGRFAREVVARLRQRPGLAAQGAAWVAALVKRPRIAWEAAYVGTAVLSLAFVLPGSPLGRASERALELVRLEAGGEMARPVARLWEATATEAGSTWNSVTANLSRGLGTLRAGDASEPEKAESKGD
jgi:RNA polymerase sigma-70 factor (ECF subfamily)